MHSKMRLYITCVAVAVPPSRQSSASFGLVTTVPQDLLRPWRRQGLFPPWVVMGSVRFSLPHLREVMIDQKRSSPSIADHITVCSIG